MYDSIVVTVTMTISAVIVLGVGVYRGGFEGRSIDLEDSLCVPSMRADGARSRGTSRAVLA